MNLKKIGKVLMSKSVGTGPSSFEKRFYRAAVSQRLRNTVLEDRQSRISIYAFSTRIYIALLLLPLFLSLSTNNCVLLEWHKIAVRIGLNDCGSVFGEYLSNNELFL
jgi:hypothetical protein